MKKSKTSKLMSGKLMRCNATDKVVQVCYPHTKLNREFTHVMEFDDLPLNLLAVGELELIVHTHDEIERRDRTNILIMLLYYLQYLEVSDLKEQYDNLMKQVEHQEINWGNALPERVDRALARRLHLRDRDEIKNPSQKPKVGMGQGGMNSIERKRNLFIAMPLIGGPVQSHTHTQGQVRKS